MDEIRGGLSTVTAAVSKLSPKNAKRVAEILGSENAALQNARLLGQPIHEVTLGGRVSQAVTFLNRAQETFFRKLAFEAKLRQLLKRNGMDFATTDPRQIPDNMLKEATDYAIEMTFAASPKSKAGQEIVRTWTRYGGTLINPFPRFNFANALPFVLDHSPLGYLHAVSPRVLKDLASGNVDEFAKAASRATLGSLMLDSAIRLRQSEYAGEKWYEIKAGDKVIDTRAYAPFSTYLFIAEAAARPENIKPGDFAQAALGMNRIAGTGLVAIDWLRGRDFEGFRKGVGKFFGQYLGSWTVPARQLSDIYAAHDPEENIVRDIADHPIAGPALLNLPKVSQLLPEKHSPVKTDRLIKAESADVAGVEVPGTLFRQLTGISFRTKKAIEREIDRTHFDWSSITPKTGVPKADRFLSKYMGQIVERIGPTVSNNENYKASVPYIKREFLRAMFLDARREAGKRLLSENPELAIHIGLKRLRKDLREIVGDRLPQYKHMLKE